MIQSAEEFVVLRESNDDRSVEDTATETVWFEIIDRFPEMRFWVAHNRTIPYRVMQRLIADPDPRVRTRVSMKRKLPVEFIPLLARDSNSGIRLGMVRRRDTPREVLEELTHDTWSEIARIARERLAVWPDPLPDERYQLQIDELRDDDDAW